MRKIKTIFTVAILTFIFTIQIITIKYVRADSTTVNIKDFGAHSIDEAGYSDFDSSSAINNAIQYAKNNGYTTVDFGSGRYYADKIFVESNITYKATGGATLIAAPTSQINTGVIQASNKSNMVFDGVNIDGNMDVVPGDIQSGHALIKMITCSNLTFVNCYLHDNWYVGISLENGCDHIVARNNSIYDTDSGIISVGTPTNYVTIDSNEIWGGKNQHSEPISIYNDGVQGLSHDITITNNSLHDKTLGLGIHLRNTSNVLVSGNTIYNTAVGIGAGTGGIDPSSNHVIGQVDIMDENITISNNDINNCGIGMQLELSDSTVSNNNVSNINGTGIWLESPQGRYINQNTLVTQNTITNVNGNNNGDVPLRVQYSKNCTLDNNTTIDDRIPAKPSRNIQIIGSVCDGNIIQNNTHLGCTYNNGQDIDINAATNTTIKDNVADIYSNTPSILVINNTPKGYNTAWLDNANLKIVLVPSTDYPIINNIGNYAYKSIAGIAWIGRTATITFSKSGANAGYITSGGNIILTQGDFKPAFSGASITLKYDGINWTEQSRYNVN
ncbi:MAG: right-handed parallel beta-helix repeat-containing protein [Bacillota bacterium]|nr:right-handed parallel beta-helix repeat-containing protein [Bacillota bacterium]